MLVEGSEYWVLGGWAVDGIARASSEPPINVTVGGALAVSGYSIQADIVPGQPFWIADPTQPAGKALNPAAFAAPPIGQNGDFPMNGLRSPYSINQTDIALRRRFNLTTHQARFASGILQCVQPSDVRTPRFAMQSGCLLGIPGWHCTLYFRQSMSWHLDHEHRRRRHKRAERAVRPWRPTAGPVHDQTDVLRRDAGGSRRFHPHSRLIHESPRSGNQSLELRLFSPKLNRSHTRTTLHFAAA
jgi:hypothetical protein